MNTSYTSQDRGDKQSYQQYLEAMDAISVEKVASASMFFEPKRGNTIVDVGMAGHKYSHSGKPVSTIKCDRGGYQP